MYVAQAWRLFAYEIFIKAIFTIGVNNQVRPNMRRPPLHPPWDGELCRRTVEDVRIELPASPDPQTSPNWPRIGTSVTSPPQAGTPTHPASFPAQRQAENSRICALLEQSNPNSMSPEQQARRKLCCKVGVSLCSFAVGGALRYAIDPRFVMPLLAVGSMSGLGLAVLSEYQLIRNAGYASPVASTTPSGSPRASSPVRRQRSLEARAPPQPGQSEPLDAQEACGIQGPISLQLK